jgi:hypothetical protein
MKRLLKKFGGSAPAAGEPRTVQLEGAAASANTKLKLAS